MGTHVWYFIASIFLISVKAELREHISQSFYETPKSSSPAPPLMQSPPPELIGMKEIVLFLTPDQVETLQAAGALVKPYPEYESELAQMHGRFQQSIELQNEQQNYEAGVENYYKLLNIQEINEDLAHHTPATEGTTEKVTTTPRHKYTKSRQQYKDKENFMPYVPKKASRPKISNQNTNSEYVRFLPNYENENLKMVPYQALPLSPYRFGQVMLFAHADTQAQRVAYAHAMEEAQRIVYAKTMEQAQRNAYAQAIEESQRNVHTEANEEAQRNANEQARTNAYTHAKIEAQRIAHTLAKQEAQANEKTKRKEIEQAQKNAYTKAKIEAQRIAHTQAKEEAQPNEPSVQSQIRGGESKKPQAIVEIPAPTLSQKPVTIQTHLRAQNTAAFKESLASIEGLTLLEQRQEKPDTPASPLPTVQTPIVHQDKLALLLAPLYNHQAITESIARQREELISGEFKIQTKLQQIKNAPQHDHQEYATELQKLTSNLKKQNALAEIELRAASKSPSVIINPGSETTESHPIDFLHVPKLQQATIATPYPVPLEIIRHIPFPTQAGKPVTKVGEKRVPVLGNRNVNIKLDNQFTAQKRPTVEHKIPVKIPIHGPEHLTIIRHIWEH